jgi:hypothetical protein
LALNKILSTDRPTDRPTEISGGDEIQITLVITGGPASAGVWGAENVGGGASEARVL